MRNFYNRMEGFGGGITIPFLGAHVGNITTWTLRRQSDEGPEAALFDLTAVLSFLNVPLWDDPDYTKEISVTFGRGGKRYLVERDPRRKAVVNGQTLYLEGVTLCLPKP